MNQQMRVKNKPYLLATSFCFSWQRIYMQIFSNDGR